MKKLLYIIILIVLSTKIFSQDYEKSSSFEGLHFMIGFIENEFYTINTAIGKELKIFIATKQQSEIEVYFPDNQNPDIYNLGKDSVQVIEVPDRYESRTSEFIDNKIIEIKSDVPVTVYAFSSQARTSDSYSAIPLANWGKEYYVMSFPNDQYALSEPPFNKQDSTRLLTPRSSEFMVVSAYDNTEITITPKAITYEGKQVNSTFSVTLDKGETYFVKSYPLSAGRGDLTGTKITSSNPVGLISGHQRTAVPMGLFPQYDTKDHLVEMLQPAESWGKTYISVPFNITPEGDLFRVLGKESGTVVSMKTSSNSIQYNLDSEINSKEFRDVTSPVIWNSNKPVQIAQYMMRTNSDERIDLFDPCMVMLSPYEQFVSRVTFHTPGNVFYNPEQYVDHFVTVIAEKEALTTISLNEALLDTTTNISNNRIADTDFYWTQIDLPNGTHVLEADFGRFSGVLFGNGKYDSYAMILGASLTHPEFEDSLAPYVNYSKNCYEINAVAKDYEEEGASGIYYAFVDEVETNNFEWNINPINPNDTEIIFTANPVNRFNDGKFVIDIYDKSGNVNKFEYFHNAVNLEIPDEISISNIDWKDSVCFDYTIKNNGIDSIKLNELILNSDQRLAIYHDQLPYFIKSGEEFSFKLCIDPDLDSTVINADLDILFDCDISYNREIKVGLSAPSLQITGIDFNEVYLNEDSCAYIYLTNDGNTNITISDLNFTNNNFILPVNPFPMIISPNKTDSVEICFNPDERIDYNTKVTTVDNFNINANSDLSGTGVAPLINSVKIDFGKKRVGTNNDSSFVIENSGNIFADINFDKFLEKSIDDNISDILENISNLNVNKESSETIDISYNPSDTNEYIQKAELNTQWKNHEQITVEITGKGTIPVIELTDIDFGTTRIYDEIIQNYTIINSVGNEKLSISDVQIINSNTEDLTINLDLIKNQQIETNDNLAIPVTFNPQRLGEHSLQLLIYNDSYPNYEFKPDTLTIKGFAIPDSNANLQVDFNYNDFYFCQNSEIDVNITNNGNLPVNVTNIYIEDKNTGLTEIISDLPNYPFILSNSNEIELTLNVFREKNINVHCDIIVETFNEFKDTFLLIIEPQVSVINISAISDFQVKPGEDFTVTFRGKFNEKTDKEMQFESEIIVPSNYWHTDTDISDLKISGNSSFTQKLNVQQTADKIKIISSESFLIPQNSNWEFSIDILPLLAGDSDTEISLILPENECFNTNNENFLSKIIEVCVFDLRNTKFISNFMEVKISPLPVNDILNIEVFVKEMQKIDISLFDMSGRKVKFEKEVNVNSGINELKLPMDDIANGSYILSLNNKFMIKNLIIVVNK